MAPRVRDELPEVYADLVHIVEADGQLGLGEALDELEIAEPCGCGDSFCASFYTGARPRRAWADEGRHRTLAEADTELVLSVDVVDDVIRYVEIIAADSVIGQSVAKKLTEMQKQSQ